MLSKEKTEQWEKPHTVGTDIPLEWEILRQEISWTELRRRLTLSGLARQQNAKTVIVVRERKDLNIVYFVFSFFLFVCWFLREEERA